jgi:hypothetical protein
LSVWGPNDAQVLDKREVAHIAGDQGVICLKDNRSNQRIEEAKPVGERRAFHQLDRVLGQTPTLAGS